MKRGLLWLAVACAFGAGLVALMLMLKPEKRWVVYYSDVLPPQAFALYDIVVFDAEKHPMLTPLKDGRRVLLGYVSLGESGANRPFPIHDEPGMKLKPNPFWPGNFVLDIRKPEWRAFVLDTLVPGVLEQGFDGIMVDTLDSALYMETLNPELYTGMHDAAVALIKDIRARYPTIKIMINRAFDILPSVAQEIDMVLVESSLANVNWETKRSALFSAPEHQVYLDKLKPLRKLNPALTIVTLDYWDPNDAAGVRTLYTTQRKHGFVPYVSTVELKDHFPER